MESKVKEGTGRNSYIAYDKISGNMSMIVSEKTTTEEDRASLEHMYDFCHIDCEFMATLKIYCCFLAAPSAPKVWMVDTVTGTKYPIFVEELCKAMQSANLYEGTLTGVWGYVKRGTRQGIYLIREIKYDENGDLIPMSNDDTIHSFRSGPVFTHESRTLARKENLQ